MNQADEYMRVLLFGLPKTGSTALTYKIAGGLPDCNIVFEPTGICTPAAVPTGNVVTKCLAPYQVSWSEINSYKPFHNRLVLITRDPRDQMVSALLYHWYNPMASPNQFRQMLEAVRRKEENPHSVPFLHLLRIRMQKIATAPEILSDQTVLYHQAAQFVGTAGDWFHFRYEDMVTGQFDRLETYLDAKVAPTQEIPRQMARVIRTREQGSWRHWFTDQDIELLRPIVEPYMKAAGYDTGDWQLAANPHISAAHGSDYLLRLWRENRTRTIRHRLV